MSRATVLEILVDLALAAAEAKLAADAADPQASVGGANAPPPSTTDEARAELAEERAAIIAADAPAAGAAPASTAPQSAEKTPPSEEQ